MPLANMRQRIGVLEKEKNSLEERVERIEKLLLDEKSPPVDEYSTWVKSDEAKKYAGLYVAFVPGIGPIASAESIKELRQAYQSNPNAKRVAIVTGP